MDMNGEEKRTKEKDGCINYYYYEVLIRRNKSIRKEARHNEKPSEIAKE